MQQKMGTHGVKMLASLKSGDRIGLGVRAGGRGANGSTKVPFEFPVNRVSARLVRRGRQKAIIDK